MKKIIYLFQLVPSLIWAQTTFTEADFNAMNVRYLKNPTAFIQNEATSNFVYRGTDGIAYDKAETIKVYEILTEVSREYSNTKIRQVGANAVLTSLIKHTVIIKPTGQKRIADELLTATFVHEKNKWLLQSATHSLPSGDLVADEASVKKVIEGQTKASYDKNAEKALSYWANVPYASYVLTSMNANLTGYEQIKNTYTMFMKANPTPDNSKIETNYTNIRIQGNTAFVKHEEVFTSDKGIVTKQNCYRYLEKINMEWKLVGSVVTPMPSVKTDDEVAIKKVIEDETQAYLDGEGKKLLSYWADKKTNESASQSLITYLGQPYAKGESMEKLQTVVLPNLKKQDLKIEREDFEIRINKDMAWATYTQKAIANGTVAQTIRETRKLERISGEWKIVYVGEQGVK
ncbi:nuclear transport factor 2 family protein [Lacihabitans sp. LS3-19]|uniref:nuclear transport factor 2 family protein n=1 Tax=Lacihabitans sp. LS3-19 TaxID=2487335 RepID=UPI0020CE697B|nr:nuclear transport factor 2 family protein [Lacihabitans sp. LS3-19]MCP9769209.1 nuclear transport factor 2 family protein [Lacihabitans sp. LS3-19]